MATYGIPAVNERFDMLRQLGNSFIVQPEALRTYMTESHLGRIDPQLLRPFLAQRSDYSSFSRSLNLEDGDVPAHSSPNLSFISATGGTNLFKGTGFTAMSDVAGAGMGKLREMLKEFDADSAGEVGRARVNGTAARGAPGSGWTTMPMYVG